VTSQPGGTQGIDDLEQRALDRGARRRAKTRHALVEAAAGLLMVKNPGDISIQRITDAAGLGIGSFYNHFGSKDELFEVVLANVADRQAELLDSLTADISDPAEKFAACLRLTARMVDSRPDLATIAVRAGLSYLGPDIGMGQRSLRDIESACAAGRFDLEDSALGLAITGGSLLGFYKSRLTNPSGAIGPAADAFALLVLRMLGMPEPEAIAVTRRPLPRLPPRAARETAPDPTRR
jgi:AcrR family transcriptional regulator